MGTLLALPSQTRDYIRREDSVELAQHLHVFSIANLFSMNSITNPTLQTLKLRPGDVSHDWPHVSPLGSGLGLGFKPSPFSKLLSRRQRT